MMQALHRYGIWFFKELLTNIALSLAAGIATAVFTRDMRAIPAGLIGGVVIDADHIFDYLFYARGRRLSLGEFLSGTFYRTGGKVYIFFHAYEYSLSLFVLGMVYPIWRWFFWSVGFAMMLHLAFDFLSYRPRLLTYSILFRAFNRFQHDSFHYGRYTK